MTDKYEKMVSFPTVKKVWGTEVIMCSTELYTLKRFIIHPMSCVSLHWHHNKDETFIFGGTEVIVYVTGMLHKVTDGNVRVKPKEHHSFYSLYGGILYETSTKDDAKDNVRIFESQHRISYEDWIGLIRKHDGCIPVKTWSVDARK